MLYKFSASNTDIDRLEPVAFKDFAGLGKLEKDLEQLIANSILEVLFEDASLLPIFQERQWQPEADVYAINAAGDLVIFELKRGIAGGDAVQQALRYAQNAGQWSYGKIAAMYQSYTGTGADLRSAHQEAFGLEHALDAKEFNNKQHLIVIGSGADDSLINAVDYWKQQGISIEFLPYRIYEIGDEKYFEFFALPYDKHRNPSDVKGVLFDTNRSYDDDSIWYMMENRCVAAFGDAKEVVGHINPGDLVFYSHKWTGIVAAARVRHGPISASDDETLQRDVEFLTPIPIRDQGAIPAMPFNKVSEVTGKNFFWARTIKRPYLSKEESDNLLAALLKHLGSPA